MTWETDSQVTGTSSLPAHLRLCYYLTPTCLMFWTLDYSCGYIFSLLQGFTSYSGHSYGGLRLDFLEYRWIRGGFLDFREHAIFGCHYQPDQIL